MSLIDFIQGFAVLSLGIGQLYLVSAIRSLNKALKETDQFVIANNKEIIEILSLMNKEIA